MFEGKTGGGVVHEAAVRTFRSSVADAATYTTSRRSVDLTYAVAIRGADLDPDINTSHRNRVAERASCETTGRLIKRLNANTNSCNPQVENLLERIH